MIQVKSDQFNAKAQSRMRKIKMSKIGIQLNENDTQSNITGIGNVVV